MPTAADKGHYQQRAAELFHQAGIYISPEEQEEIEIAEFGLGEYEQTGLAIHVYVNTDRCCAKELAMLPGQTCPQHLHPPVGDDPGKEETFRCRYGTAYLYVPGPPPESPACQPPDAPEAYSVWHEVVLNKGDQYTLEPNTWHWFQAGPEGAVLSEFSTRSTDENDVFLDERIQRVP